MPTRVLEASSVGLVAAETLAHATQATVLAAFERSVYIDTGQDLIAVIAGDLPDSPLCLRVPGLIAADTAPGERWTLAPGRLQSEAGLVIHLVRAATWRPVPPSPIDRRALAGGLDTLLNLLAARDLPADGLIRLALPGAAPMTPVEKAAAPALAHLGACLAQAFAGSSPALVGQVKKIIGLGPGLTPSGDDLLGGMLIACHRLGERRTAELLGEAVNEVAAATNRISWAHLRAAARGFGAAPLHDLLHAGLATGRRGVRSALDAAAEIGHSSGLDALAGVILALQAYLAAQA